MIQLQKLCINWILVNILRRKQVAKAAAQDTWIRTHCDCYESFFFRKPSISNSYFLLNSYLNTYNSYYLELPKSKMLKPKSNIGQTTPRHTSWMLYIWSMNPNTSRNFLESLKETMIFPWDENTKDNLLRKP